MSLESEIETLTETTLIPSWSITTPITTPSSTDPRKPIISRKRSQPSPKKSRESNEVDKLFISTLQEIKGVNQESKQDDSNSYFCILLLILRLKFRA